MPKVPTLQGPQIQERGLQTNGVNLKTSVEDFGGGNRAQAIGNSMTNALTTVNKIVQDERKRVNDTAVTEAETELLRRQGELEIQISQKKGKDSFGAVTYLNDEWGKITEEIQSKLTNDEQKQAFGLSANRKFVGSNNFAYKHTAVEGDKYELETTNSAIEALRNQAVFKYKDGDAIMESIDSQVEKIRTYGVNSGKSEEWISANTQEIKSKTHMGVLQSMINNGEDLSAKGYLEVVGKDLVAQDKIRADGILRKGNILGETRRQADILMSDDKLTNTQRIAEARKIKDPEVSQRTVAELKSRIADDKDLLVAEKKKKFEAVADKYLLNPQAFSMSNPDIIALDLADSKAIQAAVTKNKGSGVKTDPKRFLEIMSLSAEDPAAFKKLDLFKEINNLSMGDLTKFKEMQINEDKLKASIGLTSYLAKLTGKDGLTSDKMPFEQQAYVSELFEERLNEFPLKERYKVETYNKVKDELAKEVITDGRFWNSTEPFYQAKFKKKSIVAEAGSKRPTGVPDTSFLETRTNSSGEKMTGYFIKKDQYTVEYYDQNGNKRVFTKKPKKVENVQAKR